VKYTIDRVGGIDLAFQSAEDYDLCLKISEVTQIYHLQVPLYYYREHSDRISQLGLQAQTEYSGQAVRNALSRRGLADRYQLSIDPSGRFTVKKRSKSATQVECTSS
jgi:hypothetical protein